VIAHSSLRRRLPPKLLNNPEHSRAGQGVPGIEMRASGELFFLKKASGDSEAFLIL
jgi:hypothetical protein